MLAKTAKYKGFCVYLGSYLIWPPAMLYLRHWLATIDLKWGAALRVGTIDPVHGPPPGALIAEREHRAAANGTTVCEGNSTLLRGGIVNRTYGTHKNPYTSVFLPTIFGPINYGPP